MSAAGDLSAHVFDLFAPCQTLRRRIDLIRKT